MPSLSQKLIKRDFDCLKVRLLCLGKDMDVNMDGLPQIMHSCFILNNFCELWEKTVNLNIEATKTMAYNCKLNEISICSQ